MHKIAQCLTSAILLIASIGAAFAQDARVERLDIIAAGFFVYDPAATRTDAPETVRGIVIRPTNMRFLRETPAVTARKGASFGVRFFVLGEPRDADVTFRAVWKVPKPGMTDPQSGKTYMESASEFTTQVGTAYLCGYGFNEQWEIVKGSWTLEIWQGDRMLLTHNFEIR